MTNFISGPSATLCMQVSPPTRGDMKADMESLIHHFKYFSQGVKVPKGRCYTGVSASCCTGTRTDYEPASVRSRLW